MPEEKVKIEDVQNALRDVRKAFRLIYSYQTKMLDTINFISNKLGFQNTEFKFFNYFPPKKPERWSLQQDRDHYYKLSTDKYHDLWKYLFFYLTSFEFGPINNDKLALTIVQFTDTGFFDSTNNELNDSELPNPKYFATEENSCSKLLFIIQNTDRKYKWAWQTEDIIAEKINSSKNHTKEHRSNDRKNTVLYSFPIERFMNEESAMEALKELVDYCHECGITELNLVDLQQGGDSEQ